MVQLNNQSLLALNQKLPPISGFTKGIFQTTTNPATKTAQVISNIISILTIFGGLAFLVWFVIGALTWVTSGGEAQQLEKAKKQMSSAIAGFFVLIISYGIVYILGKVTGFDILNVETIINRLTP